MDPTYNALLANFGILALCQLLVSAITQFCVQTRSREFSNQIINGVVFGATTAILILFSTAFVSGAVFDSRAAPAIMSGIIGGPWAAFITALIGGAARFHVGGEWVLNGVLSVFFYCACGAAAGPFVRRLFNREITPLALPPIAVTITCLAVPIFFVGKTFDAATQIIGNVFVTLMLTNVVSVTALGILLLFSARTVADRHQLQIMKAAVTRAANGVTITDASMDRRIIFANDAVSKIFGYSNEELVGNSTDLFFGSDAKSSKVRTFREKAQNGQEVTETFVNFRKDGSRFHNQVTITPIRSSNGKITHFLGVFADVTQEMKTRATLKTVAAQVPMALIYTNLTGEVEYINNAASEMFCVEAVNAGKSPLSDVVGAELASAFGPWIDAAVAGGEIKWEERLAIIGKYDIDARLSFAPTVSENGEQIGVIISIEDITAYKQMEAALAQSQRLRSIGTLTGGIAHDFNNLNTVVIGNLDLLKLSAPNAEATEFIDEALAAARRGARLTNSLLSFGGQAMLLPNRIDLANGLADLENLLRASIKKSTSIDFVRIGAGLSVNVDQTNLESAILNLVVNADYAIGEGPGTVRIDFRKVAFDSALKDNAFAGDFEIEAIGRFAAITVSDDGPGVAPGDRDKIIEPFFTTKGRHSGAGLGLAMVHGFVRQSGGFMRITDNQPTGMVVTLYLPLAEDTPEGANAQAGPVKLDMPLLEAG